MAMSDISLTSSMRQNLISLQNTSSALSRTQDRLSSGKKVNTALDDPVNFFAAQSHMTRVADLNSRKDSMMEAVQTAKAADGAITAMTSMLEQAKSIAQSALSSTDTTTRASYGSQFNTVMSQMVRLAQDAGYKGTNMLDNNTLTVKFNEDGSAKLDMTGFSGTTVQNLTLGFIGASTVTASTFGTTGSIASWSTTASTGIDDSLAAITTAVTNLRTQAKNLATNLNVITVRQDFTKNMIDTLKTGADNLTLADMNEEGANMLMLQTRQTLGITSLSLASQAAQSVLRLF